MVLNVPWAGPINHLQEVHRFPEGQMTTIKATCPDCGEVDLTADDILLRIATGQGSNTYGFSCPSCSEFVEKPADERVIRLLLSGGVMPMLVHVPAEALETHSGPPIDHDDLLEFHELLESDDWFTQLSAASNLDDFTA
jgi:hypothetical protein